MMEDLFEEQAGDPALEGSDDDHWWQVQADSDGMVSLVARQGEQSLRMDLSDYEARHLAKLLLAATDWLSK
jgi:hypothetical protein